MTQIVGAAPSGLAGVPVAGGGTFAAGNQSYKITGLYGGIETTASAEVTVTVALNGRVNLSWSALPAGMTGVKVYRGPAGAENTLVATLGPVLAYTDAGAAGTAAAPPANYSVGISAGQRVSVGNQMVRDSQFTINPSAAGAVVKLAISEDNVVWTPVAQVSGILAGNTVTIVVYGQPCLFVRANIVTLPSGNVLVTHSAITLQEEQP